MTNKPYPPLSVQEFLEYLETGKMPEDIAALLGITPDTSDTLSPTPL